MRFFERQREHKQTSTRLLIVFMFLVLILNTLFSFSFFTLYQRYLKSQSETVHFGTEASISLTLCLSIIFFVYALFCYFSLKKKKGYDFAASIGAIPVRDFPGDVNVAQLVRCVAEMSIAARVRPPQIFVLLEDGVNAMVAGCDINSSALIVTRGAIDLLDKQELQGVIGHEFSHLYHQDISLNLKLLACVETLNGAFNVGLGIVFNRSGHRESKKDSKFLLIGLLLIIFGYLGHAAANILRSRIMREREFLADASAVQYTRDTSGLISAFCKISQIKYKNKTDLYLHGTDYDTVAHLFIFPVYQRLDRGWFATHPPLSERISRLRGL